MSMLACDLESKYSETGTAGQQTLSTTLCCCKMSGAAKANGTSRQRAVFEDEFVQGAADRFIVWTMVSGESDED
jgi:hypothetical protein